MRSASTACGSGFFVAGSLRGDLGVGDPDAGLLRALGDVRAQHEQQQHGALQALRLRVLRVAGLEPLDRLVEPARW
ncbi:hypothetical protein GCM10025868_14380 [Angustibacter aerolatus]|uniref:Uncharacterized protein n=1 Tax=Angustibacter aerolatus TaxID=1162965 RepID=A0ABQ6JDG4_9ACTN|nr:hypothetical protein GCM10025868_14380 [Angustibacter aerolatus]